MAYELVCGSVQCLLVFGILHMPYHGLCEGQRTVKSTLIVHLGRVVLAQVHSPSPGPSGGLCGLMSGRGLFSLGYTSLPMPHEMLHVPLLFIWNEPLLR